MNVNATSTTPDCPKEWQLQQLQEWSKSVYQDIPKHPPSGYQNKYQHKN